MKRKRVRITVGKSLDQYNKDGYCIGNELPLSINTCPCFDISQFSIQSIKIKKSSMESKHLIVECSLKIEDERIDTHILIDCGTTQIDFIDKDFVHHHQIQEKLLKE